MRQVCLVAILFALIVVAFGCTRGDRAETPVPDGTVLAQGSKIIHWRPRA